MKFFIILTVFTAKATAQYGELHLLLSTKILNNLTKIPAGDKCNFKHNQEVGVCKSDRECPEVIERRNKIPITTCSFQGNTPIVCCPIIKNNETPSRQDSRISAQSK